MTASACRDDPWTCPICRRRPCKCTATSQVSVLKFDANPDWVDEEVVNRFVSGHRATRPLTRAEKKIVAHRLAERGDSRNAIAERLALRSDRVRELLGEAAA